MSTDIGVISGVIELRDDFTSQLGLAQAVLSNFTKENQESLKAIAGAAALVVGAFTAIGVAAVELGKRGSEINNVNQTLQHFVGDAGAAADVMERLRAGTKGTVDDFELARQAAHLLSAGVKLTADDFSTLAQAAFVLHTRGLGGTKEQLDLVSDALVTGRTRALSMSLGVVDVGDAEENFARKLGITKDLLSQTGIAEARRLAVLDILNRAVKDAGVQEKNFGDQLVAAKVFLTNWIDEAASAVAKSPVLAAGFKAVGAAVADAFGNDKEESIKTVVGIINHAAIIVIDFGLAAVETARVFNVAWSAMKTAVLGTETVILAVFDNIVFAAEQVAKIQEKLGIIPPGAVQVIHNMEIALRAMTESVSAQAAEAAKGIVENSAFDKTLDAVGGTLYTVRDAMVAADQESENKIGTDKKVAETLKTVAASQEDVNSKFIDQAKITAALVKSSTELEGMWDNYFKLVAKQSGTSRDQQVADIEATKDAQIAALDYMDPLYAAKYDLIVKTADEATKQLGVDWDSVRDKSIEGMQMQADDALKQYNKMLESGLHFRREVLDAALQRYHDLQDAANGWGAAVVDANKKGVDSFHAMSEADAALNQGLDDSIKKVKTLAGEYITAAEAKKRFDQGTSFDVTSANFDKALSDYLTNGGWNPNSNGIQQYQDPRTLAKKGYSFAEILKYAFNGDYQGPLPPPQGPRIPGFAEGGTVMVGEKGPEVVRLPLGSTVYPTGTQPSSAGNVTFQNVWHVNGTGEEVANRAFGRLMTQLKTVRKWPAAT